MKPEIEKYFLQFSEEVQKRLKRVREIFIEVVPDCDEDIKYQMPTILWKGNLIHYAAFKNHLGIYPLPGVLRDLEEETRDYVTGKGSIQFPHDKELPEELIRRIVTMRKEEREGEEKVKKEKSAAGQEKSGNQRDKGAARPEGVYQMKFSALYPLYVLKAEKKNRTREEVDRIIQWFTGYDGGGLLESLESGVTLEEFFLKAPQMNPAADKINGVICGYRIEEITDEVMKMVRRLDKLIDELARGKAVEKILNR